MASSRSRPAAASEDVNGSFCLGCGFAVSRATGADARAFLNGQLSSDVKTLAAGHWQLSSYSTPKGRALATFAVAAPPASAVASAGDSFWLVTRHSVAEATFKRLAMFVMRSKVEWAHHDHDLIGVCGPDGADVVAGLLGAPAPAPGACSAAAADSPLATLCAPSLAAPLAMGLGGDAWWLLLPLAARDAVVAALRQSLAESPAATWDGVEVAAGRPWVEEGTREVFVPQMLNLDVTGGISFKKGCYPGQEIVARTQYMGKVKRRMLRFGVALAGTDALPAPGTPVHAAGAAAEETPQALGQVVMAAPFDSGRAQLLAVLQLDLAGAADLRLGRVDGPPLLPLPLPYELDQAP